METIPDIPRLPKPPVIRDEISRLRARIGELKQLLRLAEAQHVRPTSDAKACRDRKAVRHG